MPRGNEPGARVSWTNACLWLLLLALGLSGCQARPDPSWQQIRERGFIRVGMEANWVPFEYVDGDGQLVGLDVDLARGLGQQLGLEVRFVSTLSFDGLYDALTADRVDVIISAVVIDPARTADYAYSLPYFDAGQVLLVRPAQAGTIYEMGDLAGRRLAVELGSEGDRMARYWARRLNGLELSHHDTVEAALVAVAAGRADAALTDRASALLHCAQHGLRLSGPAITSEPYAAVVLKERQSLLGALNEALVELDTAGELDRLVEKWLCAEESCCGR